MFQAVIERAKGAVDKVVVRYTARIAVAIPFVIALGFATAAATVWLSELYGSLVAYSALAIFFTVVGSVAAVIVSANDPQPPVETEKSEPQREGTMDVPVPPAVLLAAVTRLGPIAFPMILRVFAKNLPLIVGVVVLSYLMFSDTNRSAVGQDGTATS